jgi:hypothetical protein
LFFQAMIADELVVDEKKLDAEKYGKAVLIKVPHATRNTQHATRNTQHATRNTQHATRNTQHATHVR